MINLIYHIHRDMFARIPSKFFYNSFWLCMQNTEDIRQAILEKAENVIVTYLYYIIHIWIWHEASNDIY